MKILKQILLTLPLLIIFSCTSAKPPGVPPEITRAVPETAAEKEHETAELERRTESGGQGAESSDQIAEGSEQFTENSNLQVEEQLTDIDQFGETTEEGQPLRIAEEQTQSQDVQQERAQEVAQVQPPIQSRTPQQQTQSPLQNTPQQQPQVQQLPVQQPPAQTQTPQQQPQAQQQPQPAQAQTPQRQPPAQQQQPPAQAQTPQRQPQAQQPQQPPALSQIPPSQEQQPDLLVEEQTETESDSVPPRSEYVREFPPAPAARIDSLSQTGAAPLNNNINFSRVARVVVGQILEIPFRGNGWVYLGELGSRRGIAYNSRRSEPEGMSFIFNVEEAGTFALKFFREDFTRGFILNDHVQVIASEAPVTGTGWFNPSFERSRITAEPRWPSAVEEAAIQRSGGLESSVRRTADRELADNREQGAENNEQRAVSREQLAGNNEQRTVIPSAASTTGTTPTVPPATSTITPQTSASADAPAALTSAPPASTSAQTITAPSSTAAASPLQENSSPDILLQKAKENFNGQNIPAAISLLDQYMEHYPGGSDEAYWMYGQSYEANSPSRNIMLSLDYYRRLVNEYPQSGRLTDARRRIAYLERFYVNIQ